MSLTGVEPRPTTYVFSCRCATSGRSSSGNTDSAATAATTTSSNTSNSSINSNISHPTSTGGSEVILRFPETACMPPATATRVKSRKRIRAPWTNDGGGEEGPAPSSTSPTASSTAGISRGDRNDKSDKPSRQNVRGEVAEPEACEGDEVAEAEAPGRPAESTNTSAVGHDHNHGSAYAGYASGDSSSPASLQWNSQQEQTQQPCESSAGEAGGGDRDDHEIGTTGAQPQERQLQERRRHRPVMVRVVVHEVLSEDYGLFTWPSAIVLACLVWERREDFFGAHVVEIGAGTALPGLLAAKLGAHVILTDREEAPWVLDNIRGAAAANGLPPACARGASVVRSAPPVEAEVETSTDEDGVEAAGQSGSREKEVYNGRGGLGDAGDGAVRGGSSPGDCCVHELSWGHVTASAMELATAHPRPQFILGADVFYSSEHFNSVLATVYMFLTAAEEAEARLSPAPSHDVAGSTDRVAAGCFDGISADIGHSAVGGAPEAAKSGGASDLRATPESRSRVVINGDTTKSDGGGARSSAGGDATAPRESVFLTAYHERSARRSLRPLLRKWGLVARVLRDAPRRVMPDRLWEDGRYGSVALIEISLLQGSDEKRCLTGLPL